MNDEQLVRIVPSERQLRHLQLEFCAFVHFTVNTFTDKEWGTVLNHRIFLTL